MTDQKDEIISVLRRQNRELKEEITALTNLVQRRDKRINELLDEIYNR